MTHQAKLQHLFIGNLDYSVTKRDLEDMFYDYKRDYENIVLKERYAFIYFYERSVAEECLQRMNKRMLNGRPINMEVGDRMFGKSKNEGRYTEMWAERERRGEVPARSRMGRDSRDRYDNRDRYQDRRDSRDRFDRYDRRDSYRDRSPRDRYYDNRDRYDRRDRYDDRGYGRDRYDDRRRDRYDDRDNFRPGRPSYWSRAAYMLCFLADSSFGILNFASF